MEWTVEYAEGRAMMVRQHGTGPPIVWLHGLGEWSVSFDPLAAHPALAGFTHVLPDLPGYGRSPWPAEPDDLEQLADRLAGWLTDRRAAPPIVIGHSMGGVLATLLAERGAVRAVVNVDGNLSAGDCTFSARAAAYGIDDFIAHGFATMRAEVYARGHASPGLRGYHAAMAAASPRVYHHHAGELVAISGPERMAARLAKLSLPVLFVAGVPDGICAHSRGLLDRHAVRWLGLEPAGHWVHADQPAAFVAAVAGFLSATT